jgi:hypothetical protein
MTLAGQTRATLPQTVREKPTLLVTHGHYRLLGTLRVNVTSHRPGSSASVLTSNPNSLHIKGEFPVYKKACSVDRPIRLATEEGCHAPPFGDLIPCLFNAAAIDRSVVAPCS